MQHPYDIPIGAQIGSPISANTTTVIRHGRGTILGLSVLSPGAGWSASIYDGVDASGTLLATVSLDTAGPISFGVGGYRFTTALTVITSGTTPGTVRPVNF